MTALDHARIWEAVRNVGAANAAAAAVGETSSLRRTVQLIEDAIGSLESVGDLGSDEANQSVQRDITRLRERVAVLERRMDGGR